jgi:hypothetical protein
MATSAFGGLGLNYLGQENAASGPGMDLGRALLGIGISKSGLEGWLNDKGLSVNNGQLGVYKNPTPAGGAAIPGAVAPSITAPQIQAPGELGRGTNPNAEGNAMLNNVSQAAPMTSANQQQPLPQTAMMPPPSPILGGVVPSTNFDFMSGPGVRERISKAIGGLFGAA